MSFVDMSVGDDKAASGNDLSSPITVDIYSDSIFKYIQSGDGVIVDLAAVRGGCIQDLTSVIEKKSSPDVVVMHVGTNNLTDQRTTMEGFRRDYTEMMKKLDYTYTCPIIISAILPRHDRPDLEPLRIAVNHLLGSLVASRVVNSNEKFLFLSWDGNFTDHFLFSIDGLHPSREGNLQLHRRLKANLRWILSEHRHHAHKMVVEMVRDEIQRKRREARARYIMRKSQKDNSIFTPSGDRRRPHLFRRRRRSGRPYRLKSRGSHPQTSVPVDINPRTPTLDVAGCVVVCPELSGWGLRLSRPLPKIVSPSTSKVPRCTPSLSRKASPVTCPFCCEECPDENALLDHHLNAHQEDRHESKVLSVEKRRLSRTVGKIVRQVSGGGAERTRGECAEIDFTAILQPVSHVRKLLNVDVGEYFVKVSNLCTLPPLGQLQQLKDRLLHLNQQEQVNYYVEFQSGHKYRLQEIEEAIMLHRMKSIGRAVIAEKEWIASIISPIETEQNLCPEILTDFCSLVFDNPQEAEVELHGQKVRVEDLTTLTRSKWLSNFLFMYYSTKLEAQCVGVKCSYVFNMELLPQTVFRALSSNATNQLILYSMVELRGQSSVIRIEGNHFVFAVYYPSRHHLVYADPLGRNIPDGFLSKFKLGLSRCGINSETLEVTLCHDPTSVDRSGTHKCSSACAAFYPTQTCSSICGIAAIVGFTLSALKPELFMKLVGTRTSDPEPELYQIDYLKSISYHSCFLRHVVIEWIMSSTIDMKLLLKKLDVSTVCMLNNNLDLNQYVWSQGNQREGKSNQLICPIVSPESSSIGDEDVMLQSAQTSSKLDDRQRNYRQHHKFLKYDHLEKFLRREPLLTYYKKEGKLVLRLYLNNQSKSVVKRISCSDQGCGDVEARNKVNQFLCSQECMRKVQNICEIKIPSEYSHQTDLQTGLPMKSYFDKLTFDTTKAYSVHSAVKPLYQGNANTLTVSVTNNDIWGSTHRLDELYTFKSQTVDSIVPVVTLTVQCSGNTSECRAQCGNLLTSLDRNKDITSCSGCHLDLSSSKMCSICSITDSIQWYNYKSQVSETAMFHGKVMCNACYRYIMKYRKVRPQHLINSTGNTNIHHQHFQCAWKLKCIVYSNNLDTWRVYEHKDNLTFHKSRPCQELKRPNLSDRDEIDRMRISNKVSANQIKMSFQRKISLHVDENEDMKKLRECTTKEQIRDRVKLVDRHAFAACIQKLNDIPLPQSDWRNTEKILEQNPDSVLLFQRGNEHLQQNYQLILESHENLILARKFGQFIMGYDNKYDFTSVRFPVGLLTICDNKNAGKAVAISMCNSDQANVHALTIQIVLLNVPCDNPPCDHNEEMHVFNDGNVFFKFRPCSLVNPISPIIQHDKDSSIKLAVSSIGLRSSLCNFHALQAFRRHILEDNSLKLFMKPLETGFKSVMRSWSPDVRTSLQDKYLNVINHAIPDELLPADSKAKFINYLNNYWFQSPNWSNSFTAEILYKNPLVERKNPLILTDNITERKFREMDETLFNFHINKTVTTFVMKIVNQFLYSESFLSKAVTSDSDYRKSSIRHVQKELRCAAKGLEIVQSERLIRVPNWIEHGWFGVSFESQNHETDSRADSSLPEEYFTSEASDHAQNIEYNYNEQTSSQISDIFTLSQQITKDHCYDVQSKCKQLLSKLDYKIASEWHKELLQNVPADIPPLFDENCQYICNLHIGVCSCYGFICKGQPYLCKHLYAALAASRNITQERDLVHTYQRHNPSYTPEEIAPYDRIQALKRSMEITMNSFKDRSRLLSSQEIVKRSFLSLLHDKPLLLTSSSGKLAKRQPHNLGIRRKKGPLKESNYSLVKPIDSLCDLDPYRPQVHFPERSTERHGGRKRTRIASRGVNFSTVVKTALDTLGHKMKETPVYSQNRDTSENENNSLCGTEEVDMHSPKSVITSEVRKKVDKTQSNKSRPAEIIPAQSPFFKGALICKLCVINKFPNPFSCDSQSEFDNHTATVHVKNSCLCARCFQGSGALIEFSSVSQYKLHERNVHKINVGRTMKRLDKQLHSITSSNDETSLTETSNRKGNPGIVNVSIPRLNVVRNKLSLSRKRKNPAENFLQNIKVHIKSWPCPVCEEECSDDPPSIACDKCNQWYHFTCARLGKEPTKCSKWYCQKCTKSPMLPEQ